MGGARRMTHCRGVERGETARAASATPHVTTCDPDRLVDCAMRPRRAPPPGGRGSQRLIFIYVNTDFLIWLTDYM